MAESAHVSVTVEVDLPLEGRHDLDDEAALKQAAQDQLGHTGATVTELVQAWTRG